MKRIGLLAIIGCSVSGMAIAAGVDCNVIPSCAEMGFDKTVAECGESKVLRCPFDLTNDDAVFCNSGCATGGGCDEDFNLDACPEGGICSDCGEKYELVVCDTGYTRDGDTCCSGTGYKFETCPTNGQCTLCGTKYKLDSCDTGYTITDDGCCSDTTYNLTSCPSGGVCTQCGVKYSFTGCKSGYTQSGTTCCSNSTYSLSSCPANATGCTQCGSKYKVNGCKTGYAGADCSSCAAGYVIPQYAGNGKCEKCLNGTAYNIWNSGYCIPATEFIDGVMVENCNFRDAREYIFCDGTSAACCR